MGGERETKTTASVSRAKDMLEIGSVRIHEKVVWFIFMPMLKT